MTLFQIKPKKNCNAEVDYRQQQFWISDAEFNDSKIPFELSFFIKFLDINFIFI